MSLHLGNISPHIRRDELERVFRRFGKCTIRVVDKYGFVVFDYPASAEKALKSLRGKRICGEAITISWSKRQPRVWPGHPRGGKFYEPPVRRHLVNKSVDQRLEPNNQEGNKMDYEQEDGQSKNVDSSYLADELHGYHPDDLKGYAGEKDHAFSNDNLDVGVGKNHLDVDSWREQVVDVNGFENAMEFDRYEPRESDDEKDQGEYDHASPSDGSPAARKSNERLGTEKNGKSKFQKTCYTCGEVGHKMNVCPLLRSRSQGRLHGRSDLPPMRLQESNREPSTSRSCRRLLRRGDSPFRRITPDFRGKKRSSREYENHVKHHSKRARGLLSSSIHHRTSSRSQSLSRSLRSLSQSPSNSKFKSVSSGNNIQSFSLRPSSCHSGSKGLESRSATRSMSPTSSAFAVGRVRDLSSSQNSKPANTKDLIVKVAGLVNSKNSLEHWDERSGVASFNTEKITAAMENEHEAGPSKLDKEKMRKDLLERSDAHCESATKVSGSLFESNVPRPEDDYSSAGYLLSRRLKDVQGSQPKDLVLEDISTPGPCITSGTNAVSSVSMSSQEICMVLKHYGLWHPEENGNDMPVETYFGSARLWPWEIIYYRRMKKDHNTGDRKGSLIG
ncbi:Splicing factor, arginine/serine-rich [Dorcoceras hygrometricum]|uniref:Splicing factor, arginine/serine-rich n=1 Tax=Dorcoceras hygrometricum TaxID=472368 RepID=A0A2Z7B363_9LAMI|nr:Splicing factor, arginine/serine-rich [Dorcoceras hygrometricum]